MSPNTTSTPDPGDAAAAGAPDPLLIAQLANAFFTALPGQTLPPHGAGGALPSANVPTNAPLLPPGITPSLTGAPQPGGGPPSTPALPNAASLHGTGPASSVPGIFQAAYPSPGSPTPAPAPGYGSHQMIGADPAAQPANYHSPGAATPALSPIPLSAPREPGDVPQRAGEIDFASVPQALAAVLGLVPRERSAPTGYDAPSLPGGGTTPSPSERPYFLDDVTAIQPAPASPIAATPPRHQPLEFRPALYSLEPGSVPALHANHRPFDPHAVRRDFPILQEQVHGKRLIWFDNAATTQKPTAVIDRLAQYYERENSNVHRGAHTLAARATDAYENARETVRRFLGASSPKEIVFVRGATEGINLVAQSWGRRNVREGDEIVITWLEHHANIVPWQQLCAEKGAVLRVAPVDDTGQIILEEYERLLNPRTKIVSIAQVSNALGTVTPVREMIAIAQRHGARTLVDGAQSVSHMRVDVQALGCDFLVFSGHKIFGPTGIGVVWGRKELLDSMPPWQGGGNMIADVTFEKTVYHPAPERFEAGTGNIGDAVGLGAALEYVESIGMEVIGRYEHELLAYATERVASVPGLRIIGTAAEKASVLSFVLDGCPTEKVGGLLDREGIAVRSGHHCAQPILRRFGLEASVRASLAFYNTAEEVDALAAALMKIQNGRRA